MKNDFNSFYFFLVVLITGSSFQVSNEWKISDNYSVKFETSYAEGEFGSINGTILFDESSLDASKFEITIDVSSISTGNSLKDKHAKKEKWFGAEKFPTITFISSSISQTTNGYEVIGKLNMHGVKKEISIPFTFNKNSFKGSFIINRLDYKVGTDTGFSSIVGTDVKIGISIPVERK